MEKQQKVLITMILITTIFFFLLFMLTLSFIFVQHNDSTTGLTKLFINYHIHFMILLGIFGISLGSISYSSFNTQQKNLKQTHKNSKEILFRFLEPTEKIVIKHLVANQQEKITQAKIAHLQNIGKVKAHRTILKLEEKKLITTQAIGKTKEIELHPEIKNLFEE